MRHFVVHPLLLLLAACATTPAVPPRVDLAELVTSGAAADSAQLIVRIHNVSHRELAAENFFITLVLDESITLHGDLGQPKAVAPNSSDTVAITVPMSADALALLAALERGERVNIPYRLTFSLSSNRAQHNRRDKKKTALYRVPGRSGHFR